MTQAAHETAPEKSANLKPALTDAQKPAMAIIDKPERAQVALRRTKKMTGDHPRNTGPMLLSQRCGAKTRSGKPCMSPAVSGKKRCRMHGGAPGSGAPRGNNNALKHGLYTREAIENRQQLRAMLRQSRMLIQKTE